MPRLILGYFSANPVYVKNNAMGLYRCMINCSVWLYGFLIFVFHSLWTCDILWEISFLCDVCCVVITFYVLCYFFHIFSYYVDIHIENYFSRWTFIFGLILLQSDTVNKKKRSQPPSTYILSFVEIFQWHTANISMQLKDVNKW